MWCVRANIDMWCCVVQCSVCRHAVDFANVCESESESESESERVRERESARVCESEGMGGKRQTKARR